MRLRLWLALLLLAATPAPTLVLDAGLTYQTSAPAVLERSTADLSRWQAVDDRIPVLRIALPATEGTYVDTQTADNTTYTYRLVLDGWYSPVCTVTTPDRPLPELVQPDLLIDKVNYYLEVRDLGVPVKRYPISMGPRCGRKVCLDRASTPEGRYQISGVQLETDYHSAFDLTYPNPTDKVRHAFYRRHGMLPENSRPIGGDIQIHGQGDWYQWDWNLRTNWTWGCVAMRDADLDELLSQPAIGKGTRVTIVGWELTREDLVAIDRADRAALTRALQRELGPQARCDAETLGCWQLKHNLPVTCQPDARTQSLLLVRPSQSPR